MHFETGMLLPPSNCTNTCKNGVEKSHSSTQCEISQCTSHIFLCLCCIWQVFNLWLMTEMVCSSSTEEDLKIETSWTEVLQLWRQVCNVTSNMVIICTLFSYNVTFYKNIREIVKLNLNALGGFSYCTIKLRKVSNWQILDIIIYAEAPFTSKLPIQENNLPRSTVCWQEKLTGGISPAPVKRRFWSHLNQCEIGVTKRYWRKPQIFIGATGIGKSCCCYWHYSNYHHEGC